ncbi:MAG: ABC transporter ATP-binding protein [Synergistaceae bacterium]|nr:ABC transporter ATP-binding protein [Synergistaceae bacterium]
MIELTGIRKSFRMGDGELEVLHGIDMRVESGEFIAMMGPSGSGKSTTMNILGCLDTPTSGRYILDGQDVGDLDGDELAMIRNKMIGFVFQGFNLLQRTSALANVEMPMLYSGTRAKERRARAKEVLERMGLGDRMSHDPSQLSGGQQQRVAIARGIVNRAPILMADEPTGNLDSKTSDEIMKLFQELNEKEGITIALVTHEPDVASYSGRIMHFKDGLITSDEPNGRKGAQQRDLIL